MASRTPAGRELLLHDRHLGVRYVAGADEAGRGALAGPIVAAAVLFEPAALTPEHLTGL
jgi:ribonuclease HII